MADIQNWKAVKRKLCQWDVQTGDGEVVATFHDDEDGGRYFAERVARFPAMQEHLQIAVDAWMHLIESEEPIDGADAVQWLRQYVTDARDMLRGI